MYSQQSKQIVVSKEKIIRNDSPEFNLLEQSVIFTTQNFDKIQTKEKRKDNKVLKDKQQPQFNFDSQIQIIQPKMKGKIQQTNINPNQNKKVDQKFQSKKEETNQKSKKKYERIIDDEPIEKQTYKIPKALTYDFIQKFFQNKENQGTDLLNEACLAATQRIIILGDQQQEFQTDEEFQTYAFQRQQVTMEEVRLRNQILNSMGKYMEQAKLENQDKKKILKDITFHCQTLSPDNIDFKLQKLLVHAKDEYGKKCLVNVIIDKACTQPKYVSTYANLCYSIILELKNNPEYKESKDNSFKSQIIGRFQTMFAQEYILDKPDLFKNMDEKSIEKYFKRNKKKLFQFVNFIGELLKVKVIPFKLAQICQNLILVNYLETFFFQFQDEKIIQDDDKYIYNNDQLEVLVEYIKNIGRFVEEREKKEKITFQESQHAIIDEIITGIKSKQKDFDFNKYKQNPEQFTIEFYIKFLKKMQEEKLCEKRIKNIIQDLEDLKNRGWEQYYLSKQNTNAVINSEVQSQNEGDEKNENQVLKNKLIQLQKQFSETIQQKDQEIKKKNYIIEQKTKEIQQMNDEIEQQNDLIEQKDEEIKQNEEIIEFQDQQMILKDEEIQQKDNQIKLNLEIQQKDFKELMKIFESDKFMIKEYLEREKNMINQILEKQNREFSQKIKDLIRQKNQK